MTPSPNTTSSVVVGVPSAIIIAWVFTLNGVMVPGEVQAAGGAVISAMCGYIIDLMNRNKQP